MNFFDQRCQTITSSTRFGICDDVDEQPAYINEKNSDNWIAVVSNESAKEITFTTVDKCVFRHDKAGNDSKRCDCMLTYTDNIVFVELKDERKEWISGAIEQLEATINSYKATHNLEKYRHKRAFAANKRHPNFHTIDNETMKNFFDNHGVRLNVQAEIVVK
jgi:hypothetical protein